MAKVESSQKSNGMWFSDIFSRHICSTVAETIGVTNNPASFGAKNVQKTTFEAAEMILGPWNQQTCSQIIFMNIKKTVQGNPLPIRKAFKEY